MAHKADPTDKRRHPRTARRLHIVLGDQLNIHAAALKDLDGDNDAVLMMEVREEAEHVPSHKQRTVLFLSAMRHFAADLIDKGQRVRYIALDDPANTQSFATELERAAKELKPERITVQTPGEHRVRAILEDFASSSEGDFDILEDDHFLAPLDRFLEWADGRKSLTMEFFYRERRKETGVLMHKNGKPRGGEWNFDKQNREVFKQTPRPPKPYTPRPDDTTKAVIKLVEKTWPNAPGSLKRFDWPVTREQALRALDDFIENRLHRFGTYEDAMWTESPVLYHAKLSPALNLKLISPRECIDKALDAHGNGHAEINNVEGFVRQLLGWREYIRGIYFLEGEDYPHRNGLDQHAELPEFFWNADTDMRCMNECLSSVIDNAYSHHIPRLMVIGNFALLAGVHPRHVHKWFLAMYADAVEWATAPNVVGMSQHADRRPDGNPRNIGIVATKPYVSSGKYINRMSNFCEHCKYDVNKRTTDDEPNSNGGPPCPFNTLYWDFLIRHRETFRHNNRMAMILKNVDRMTEKQKTTITVEGKELRKRLEIGDPEGS